MRLKKQTALPALLASQLYNTASLDGEISIEAKSLKLSSYPLCSRVGVTRRAIDFLKLNRLFYRKINIISHKSSLIKRIFGKKRLYALSDPFRVVVKIL